MYYRRHVGFKWNCQEPRIWQREIETVDDDTNQMLSFWNTLYKPILFEITTPLVIGTPKYTTVVMKFPHGTASN